MGGGHHGGGGGGHHHHGGGGFRGGAYFGPGYGYGPYFDDYAPSVLIVGDDCPSRVRSSCASSYPNNHAKQSGCREAGYARCGTSGFGVDAGATITTSPNTTVRRVAILAILAVAATTAFVLSRKKSGRIR
jgi:hypothetical protein